jgi:ATP-dependent DNA ligase
MGMTGPKGFQSLRPRSRAYLDGELCALNRKGVSGFGALQAVVGSDDNGHLIHFVFDLLFFDAEDIGLDR